MPLDATRWKRSAAFACVAVAVALAAAGTYGFLISMRPCRLQLDPGTVVDYRLSTTYVELHESGESAPREVSAAITLVCIGQGNEVALVEPGARDGVSLLTFQSDGTARLVGDEGLSDVGKALGFFDFNLLPLPAGLEQSWKVSLVYAALPPGRRQVLGQVRRTANAARPEFELRLPTVEWVNDQDRYVQVRNLVCKYRFDPGRGVVDRARVRCETGLELAGGSRRYRIEVALDLIDVQTGVGDTAALRDLALASNEAETLLDGRHPERLLQLLQRIEGSGVRTPALREVAERLRIQANARMRPAPPQPRPQPGPEARRPAQPGQTGTPLPAPVGSWRLQVASIKPDRREAAEGLVAKLAAQGIPAQVETSGSWLVVRSGPYPTRTAGLAERIQALTRSKPVWQQVPARP